MSFIGRIGSVLPAGVLPGAAAGGAATAVVATNSSDGTSGRDHDQGRFETKGGVAGVGSAAPSAFKYLFGITGPSAFSAYSTADQVADAGLSLEERVAIITGGFGGIGAECARVLAARGCHVILAGRNIKAAEALAHSITTHHQGARVRFLYLDLADLGSVRQFVSEFLALGLPLHILVNNAAVLPVIPFQLTHSGHEAHFGVNHLGHFLLTMLLLDMLKKCGTSDAPARIVGVTCESMLAGVGGGGARIKKVSAATSSGGGGGGGDGGDNHNNHNDNDNNNNKDNSSGGGGGGGVSGGVFEGIDDESVYSASRMHAVSKLAVVLFMRTLNEKLSKSGAHVIAVAAHPGQVSTPSQQSQMTAFQSLVWSNPAAALVVKTVQQGASTIVYGCVGKDVVGGELYVDNNIAASSVEAHSRALAAQLWKLSCEWTGVPEGGV